MFCNTKILVENTDSRPWTYSKKENSKKILKDNTKSIDNNPFIAPPQPESLQETTPIPEIFCAYTDSDVSRMFTFHKRMVTNLELQHTTVTLRCKPHFVSQDTKVGANTETEGKQISDQDTVSDLCEGATASKLTTQDAMEVPENSNVNVESAGNDSAEKKIESPEKTTVRSSESKKQKNKEEIVTPIIARKSMRILKETPKSVKGTASGTFNDATASKLTTQDAMEVPENSNVNVESAGNDSAEKKIESPEKTTVRSSESKKQKNKEEIVTPIIARKSMRILKETPKSVKGMASGTFNDATASKLTTQDAMEVPENSNVNVESAGNDSAEKKIESPEKTTVRSSESKKQKNKEEIVTPIIARKSMRILKETPKSVKGTASGTFNDVKKTDSRPWIYSKRENSKKIFKDNTKSIDDNPFIAPPQPVFVKETTPLPEIFCAYTDSDVSRMFTFYKQMVTNLELQHTTVTLRCKPHFVSQDTKVGANTETEGKQISDQDIVSDLCEGVGVSESSEVLDVEDKDDRANRRALSSTVIIATDSEHESNGHSEYDVEMENAEVSQFLMDPLNMEEETLFDISHKEVETSIKHEVKTEDISIDDTNFIKPHVLEESESYDITDISNSYVEPDSRSENTVPTSDAIPEMNARTLLSNVSDTVKKTDSRPWTFSKKENSKKILKDNTKSIDDNPFIAPPQPECEKETTPLPKIFCAYTDSEVSRMFTFHKRMVTNLKLQHTTVTLRCKPNFVREDNEVGANSETERKQISDKDKVSDLCEGLVPGSSLINDEESDIENQDMKDEEDNTLNNTLEMSHVSPNTSQDAVNNTHPNNMSLASACIEKPVIDKEGAVNDVQTESILIPQDMNLPNDVEQNSQVLLLVDVNSLFCGENTINSSKDSFVPIIDRSNTHQIIESSQNDRSGEPQTSSLVHNSCQKNVKARKNLVLSTRKSEVQLKRKRQYESDNTFKKLCTDISSENEADNVQSSSSHILSQNAEVSQLENSVNLDKGNIAEERLMGNRSKDINKQEKVNDTVHCRLPDMTSKIQHTLPREDKNSQEELDSVKSINLSDSDLSENVLCIDEDIPPLGENDYSYDVSSPIKKIRFSSLNDDTIQKGINIANSDLSKDSNKSKVIVKSQNVFINKPNLVSGQQNVVNVIDQHNIASNNPHSGVYKLPSNYQPNTYSLCKPISNGIFIIPTLPLCLIPYSVEISQKNVQAAKVSLNNVQASMVLPNNVQAVNVSPNNIQTARVSATQTANVLPNNEQIVGVLPTNIKADGSSPSKIPTPTAKVSSNIMQTTNIMQNNIQITGVLPNNMQIAGILPNNIQSAQSMPNNITATNVTSNNALNTVPVFQFINVPDLKKPRLSKYVVLSNDTSVPHGSKAEKRTCSESGTNHKKSDILTKTLPKLTYTSSSDSNKSMSKRDCDSDKTSSHELGNTEENNCTGIDDSMSRNIRGESGFVSSAEANIDNCVTCSCGSTVQESPISNARLESSRIEETVESSKDASVQVTPCVEVGVQTECNSIINADSSNELLRDSQIVTSVTTPHKSSSKSPNTSSTKAKELYRTLKPNKNYLLSDYPPVMRISKKNIKNTKPNSYEEKKHTIITSTGNISSLSVYPKDVVLKKCKVVVDKLDDRDIQKLLQQVKNERASRDYDEYEDRIIDVRAALNPAQIQSLFNDLQVESGVFLGKFGGVPATFRTATENMPKTENSLPTAGNGNPSVLDADKCNSTAWKSNALIPYADRSHSSPTKSITSIPYGNKSSFTSGKNRASMSYANKCYSRTGKSNTSILSGDKSNSTAGKSSPSIPSADKSNLTVGKSGPSIPSADKSHSTAGKSNTSIPNVGVCNPPAMKGSTSMPNAGMSNPSAMKGSTSMPNAGMSNPPVMKDNISMPNASMSHSTVRKGSILGGDCSGETRLNMLGLVTTPSNYIVHLGPPSKTHDVQHQPLNRNHCKKYICKFCGQEFSSRKLFRNHAQTDCKTNCQDALDENLTVQGKDPHYEITNKVKCSECDTYSITFSSLRDHILGSHTNGEHICNICNNFFQSKVFLVEHVLVHTEYNCYSCNICKAQFTGKNNLVHHELIKHGKAPSASNLQEQRKTDDVEQQQKTPNIQEQKTPDAQGQQKTSNIQGQNKTVNRVTGKYDCLHCAASLSNFNSLKKHILVGHTNGQNMCNICEKVFILRSQLLQHVIVHTGIKHHGCNICLKRFVHKKNLNAHMIKKHNKRILQGLATAYQLPEENPCTIFVCKICCKSFPSSTEVEKHLESHKSTKLCSKDSFICYLCAQTFSVKKKFKEHLRMHKSNSAPPNSYVCKVCQKTFLFMQDLISHMKSHNDDIEAIAQNFICRICQKVFTRKDDLHCHLKLHEGVQETCLRCQESFPFKLHAQEESDYKNFVCSDCQKNSPIESK